MNFPNFCIGLVGVVLINVGAYFIHIGFGLITSGTTLVWFAREISKPLESDETNISADTKM